MAITSPNTPRRLGAPRRPQDFLRGGFAQRPAKSRPRRVPAALGRGVPEKRGAKGRKSRISPWSGGAKSTWRSALPEHRGEQPVYPFRSQMAKVEPGENCLEIPDSAHIGTSMSRQQGQKWPVLPPRVGEKYGLDATLAIFQTVSEGVFCEVRTFSEVYELSGRCTASSPRPAVSCTGRQRGLVTHPGCVPSLRRRAFIFPSRNCASTTPSDRS